MPREEIDRLRSLLAHAHEQENAEPSSVQDLSRTTSVHDQVDHLRSLLAHAHETKKMNPLQKLVSRITETLTPPIKQPSQRSGKNRSAKNRDAA